MPKHALFLVAALSMLCGIACNPKVVIQPPVIAEHVDTLPVVLPPSPPIIILPDSAELVIDIAMLCDSLWRLAARDCALVAKGDRIKAYAAISPSFIRFTCREDSLIILLDSIRTHTIRHKHTQSQSVTIHQCPQGWSTFQHQLLKIALVLCVFLCISLALRRIA